MVIIVDMHMHALQFINFTKFNFKKSQLLVFQKDPVDELLIEYSSFLEKALLRCGTKFSEKIVPGTKIFTENFVPPEQFFPDQNSSDRPLQQFYLQVVPDLRWVCHLEWKPIPFGH